MGVEVQFVGRFGNNLFQYALGRIIAETLGYELNCRRPPATDIDRVESLSGNYAILPDLVGYLPRAPLHISGKKILEPYERYVLGEGSWRGHGIPLQAVLDDRRDRRILLRGYFQRMQYFEPYRDKIRSWFKPTMVPPGLSPDPDDVVVNIRRGYDYLKLGWALSLNYYVDILEKINPRRVYVCGVGIDDKVREALESYAPIYYSGTPIEEYSFISSFNRIVLSNSTFAWWAAWISDATEIFFPKCRDYWGEKFPDVDLEAQEERYIYVENVGTEVWRPFHRNPAVTISLSEPTSEGHVIVSIGQGSKTTQFMFSAFSRPVLEWIASQTDSFGPADLLPYVEATEAKYELQRILFLLISANGIEADDLYLNALGMTRKSS